MQLESPQSLVGTVIGSRYRLDRVIHQGAQVWVFHAWALADSRGDRGTGLEAAIKIRHSPMPIAAARFAREVEVLQALPPSPHVVGYLDSGVTEGGRDYLALEYIDGITLDQGMVRSPTLEPRKAVALVAEVGQALSGLHLLGVVHQQVTPGNILIDRREGLKLIDLGMVRDTCGVLPSVTTRDILEIRELRREISRTLSPDILAAMAPEQLAEISGTFFGNITVRSDVHSLGILLFQLIAGGLPTAMSPVSSAESAWDELLRYSAWRCQLEDQELPSCPGVDGHLEEILSRALRRHPIQRQQDAGALREELLGYLRAVKGAHDTDQARPQGMTRLEEGLSLEGLTNLFFPEESPGDTSRELVVVASPDVVEEEAFIEVDFNLSTTEIMEALGVDSLAAYKALLESEVELAPLLDRGKTEVSPASAAEAEAPQVFPESPVMVTPPPISITNPLSSPPPQSLEIPAPATVVDQGPPPGHDEGGDPPAEEPSDRAATRQVDLNARTRQVELGEHLPSEVAEIYRRRLEKGK